MSAGASAQVRWAAASAVLVLAAAAAPAQGESKPPAGEEPAAERRPPQPMPVPRALVKRRDRDIAIDGAVQDWPAAQPLLLDDIRQLSGTAMNAWHGAEDLAAQAFFLWDDEHLFFAAVVRDDWHRPLGSGADRMVEIPPADSVLLTFDPGRDTRASGADEGRREDRGFWLAEVENQGRRVVLWDRFRGVARYANGAAAAVVHDRERRITTYEARLPWQEILPVGRKPSPGDVLDAQVVVSDYDEATDPLPQTRVGWTFGTGSRIDPGLMGSLMLMAPAQEPPREMPPLPPPPRQSGAPVPGQGYWVELQQALQSQPPAPVGRDSGPAAAAGGPKRRDALRALERALAAFPRVDYLEYHQRVHRRMLREVAGVVATGLPFFWDYALADVGRRAAEPPPTGLRVFRLPVGGWLVRSDTANFAIDPAGHSIERHLWGALDFVLLTDPRDITKRNDQTLVRLSAARREIYAHQAMHLPGIDASKFPIVQIGQTYVSGGLKIHVLGIQQGDLVSPTVGYAVEWPDGRTLVHTGCVADEAAVAAALPPGRQVDVLLLSAQHPAARAVGRRIAARVTLLDDVLQCASAAGPDGRVALQAAFDLQMALRPQTTFLLAPGDAVDLERAEAK